MILLGTASLIAASPIAIGVLGPARLFAQQREPAATLAFEVASVKLNRSGAREGSFQFSPGGERLTVRNTFLGVIIMRAFEVDELQFTRPTPPLLRERYDLDAKADHPVSRAEMMRLLQNLLRERFKLSLRRETKEVSGHALVVAKGGPKLRPHAGEPVDCRTRRGNDGRLIYENCSMAKFVTYSLVSGMAGLAGLVGSPFFIADETGLKGDYDFELIASREIPANPNEGRPEPVLINPEAPSIFTALQEQLGLKLEPRRIPVEFYTVDHVERPTEN